MLRLGLRTKLPSRNMKRLDMTTRRSEVFLTGRNRLRGTLMPGRDCGSYSKKEVKEEMNKEGDGDKKEKDGKEEEEEEDREEFE